MTLSNSQARGEHFWPNRAGLPDSPRPLHRVWEPLTVARSTKVQGTRLVYYAVTAAQRGFNFLRLWTLYFSIITFYLYILAEPASRASLLSKFGNLLIREILVMTSAFVRPSVQTLREGEGRMPSFLGGKLRGAFGQPLFFLAGNGMTIAASEKEVSLKT